MADAVAILQECILNGNQFVRDLNLICSCRTEIELEDIVQRSFLPLCLLSNNGSILIFNQKRRLLFQLLNLAVDKGLGIVINLCTAAKLRTFIILAIVLESEYNRLVRICH